MTDLRRGARDEGVALVVALVMVLVVFLLITAVLGQAIYNISQAGYSRRQVQAINAAEAGLNWFSNRLQQGTIKSLTNTVTWSREGDRYVAINPAGARLNVGSFTVKVRYLLADPCTGVNLANPACSPSVGQGIDLSVYDRPDLSGEAAFKLVPSPLYAMVYSTGTVGQAVRTLESPIRLHRQSLGMPTAVGSTSMCFGEHPNGTHVTLTGDIGIIPGSAWPSGMPEYATCPSSGMVITGSKVELVRGSLSIAGGGLTGTGQSTYADINGVVWAEGPLTLGVGASGATVGATSCDGATDICIRDDAYGSAASVLGSRTKIMGQFSTSAGIPPVLTAFPEIPWQPALWQQAGYSISETLPALDTLGGVSSKTVFHTSGTVAPQPSDTVTVNTDIVIVADGFDIGSTVFTGTGSLSLIVPYIDPSSCYGTTHNIMLHNGPSFNVPMFFYTPCVWDARNNQNPIRGQVVARYVYFEQQGNVSFQQVTPTGVPAMLSGFSQDVRYIREFYGTF